MKKQLFLVLLLPLFGIAQIQIGSDIIGNNSDRLGQNIQLSLDGSTLALATLNDVRIFRNVSGSWVKMGDDLNGSNVSISADGNIIAVGDSLNDDSDTDAGSVTLYEFVSGNWIQMGNTIYGEAAEDKSGGSVSLSSAGNVIAIGATGNDAKQENSGHVRVFEFNVNTSTWDQIGNDIDGEIGNALYGSQISLSGNGNVLVIGAPSYAPGYNYGYVEIYENVSGTWTKMNFASRDFIIGFDVEYKLGTGVSISDDGKTMAVGIPLCDTANGDNSGRVDIYEFDESVFKWLRIGVIEGEDENDYFGYSVSLSVDGSILAVGAPFADSDSEDLTGHVKIYKNSSDTWSQIGSTINGDLENGSLGAKVSLSGNGDMVSVSAPLYNMTSFNGLVRTFDIEAVLSTKTLTKDSFTLYPVPVKDVLHLNLSSEFRLDQVSIYNALGQVVKVTKEKTINVSNLSKGLYVVSIVTNQGSIKKQIIID